MRKVMDSFPDGRIVDMKYEQNRFNSLLRGIPNLEHSRMKKFAKAGFRFLNGQLVCFSCNLSLGSEFTEDDVFEHHKTRNPHCLFVRGVADNVPMSDAVGFQFFESFVRVFVFEW